MDPDSSPFWKKGFRMQIAKSYKSLHLKNRKSVISTLLCITDLFDVAIYEISDIRFAI